MTYRFAVGQVGSSGHWLGVALHLRGLKQGHLYHLHAGVGCDGKQSGVVHADPPRQRPACRLCHVLDETAIGGEHADAAVRLVSHDDVVLRVDGDAARLEELSALVDRPELLQLLPHAVHDLKRGGKNGSESYCENRCFQRCYFCFFSQISIFYWIF